MSIDTTYNDRARDEWTIIASLNETLLGIEAYPASYDVLSIDWDDSLFTYRSKKDDTTSFWLKDASLANKGSLVWSLKDNTAYYTTGGVSTYVGVKQKIFGAPQSNTAFSVKFAHTYDKTQKSTTQGGEASLVWGAELTLGVNWSVTKTTVEDNWTKANVVSIRTN